MRSVDAINAIDRKGEVPETGSVCDFLWADPVESEDGTLDDKEFDFIKNTRRGCSVVYGYS